ncbi:MAG TPA: hypothetical protein VFQ39_02675 [Longimicrobium sp.]|nr:hypothetical protein [Longimicrobium sp.]
MRVFTVAAGIGIVLAACARPATPPSAPGTVTEDAAVWSAVLREKVKSDESRTIVLRDATVPPFTLDSLRRLTLGSELVRALSEANARSGPVRGPFSLPNRVVLVSPKARDHEWSRLRDKYPDAGGVIAVSLPGYDAGRTRAIVYMAYDCGFLCGEGTMVVLARDTGGWRVEKSFGLWIS